MARATGLMLCLKKFMLSVQLSADKAAVEGMIRIQGEKARLLLPRVQVELDALARGLPLVRKMLKEEAKEETEEEQTQAEVAAGRQAVLKPVGHSPTARGVGKRKESSSSSSALQARSGQDPLAKEAQEREKASLVRAEQVAKKQRLSDQSEAKSKASPPKAKPRPKSAKSTSPAKSMSPTEAELDALLAGLDE